MRDRFDIAGSLLGLAVCCWLAAAPAYGQPKPGQHTSRVDPRQEAALANAGLNEQLGTTVPLELVFQDETGRDVRLGDYFDGERPVVLNLVYHDCPMLCSVLLNALTETLQELEWVPGQEFDIVTVSFSPVETPAMAARQKEQYLAQLGRPAAAAGWHFLTGPEASIAALAQAVGFGYQWVDTQREYAHPAVLMFVSGEGVLTRYLYGLAYPPRDVRTALVEASEGKVGNVLDRVVLYCFQFDPDANSYVLHAVNLMKVGGLLTVLALGAVLVGFWRRERRELDETTA